MIEIIIFLRDDYFAAVELGRLMSTPIRIIVILWNGDPLFLSESKEFALKESSSLSFFLLVAPSFDKLILTAIDD